MTNRLDLLSFMPPEDPADLMPLTLAEEVWITVLAARDPRPLAARLQEIEAQPVPVRANNRLRHVAGLQCAADLLGSEVSQRLSTEDLIEAAGSAMGSDLLWETLTDLALAYALRHRMSSAVAALRPLRQRAPLGLDPELMTLLLHLAGAPPGGDGLSRREAGAFAAGAAVTTAGTARVASLLAATATLDAPSNAMPALLREQAWSWHHASLGLEPPKPRWAMGPRGGVELQLQLGAWTEAWTPVLPWALADLVYRWPAHVQRMSTGQVRVADIRGAKSRGAVGAASREGGVSAVLLVEGSGPSPADLRALEQRQAAGIEWWQARDEFAVRAASGLALRVAKPTA